MTGSQPTASIIPANLLNIRLTIGTFGPNAWSCILRWVQSKNAWFGHQSTYGGRPLTIRRLDLLPSIGNPNTSFLYPEDDYSEDTIEYPEDPNDDEDVHDEEVAAIHNVRTRRGVTEFLVRRSGWEERDWVAEDELNCRDSILRYLVGSGRGRYSYWATKSHNGHELLAVDSNQ